MTPQVYTFTRSVGIDVSSRKIAVASLDHKRQLQYDAIPIPDQARGAIRLKRIRRETNSLLARLYPGTVVAVVEEPYVGAKSSPLLLKISGVVEEATQWTFPGAVVIDCRIQRWKIAGGLGGNAKKPEIMARARDLGYDENDQDIADAVVMAAAGWVMWKRDVEPTEVAA